MKNNKKIRYDEYEVRVFQKAGFIAFVVYMMLSISKRLFDHLLSLFKTSNGFADIRSFNDFINLIDTVNIESLDPITIISLFVFIGYIFINIDANEETFRVKGTIKLVSITVSIAGLALIISGEMNSWERWIALIIVYALLLGIILLMKYVLKLIWQIRVGKYLE